MNTKKPSEQNSTKVIPWDPEHADEMYEAGLDEQWMREDEERTKAASANAQEEDAHG